MFFLLLFCATQDVDSAERELRTWSGELTLDKGKALERTSTTPAGESFSYGLWIPEGYTPERAWPLLLTLHGTNRNDDPSAGPKWMSVWLRHAGLREKFIVLAPTSVRWTWGNLAAHARIFQALDEVRRQCRVDPDRVLVDGMSMGAGGAWNLGEHYPDRWAAIAPRCGAPHLRRKKDGSLLVMLGDNFRNLPVYHVAGAKDALVPVDYARAGYEALKSFGYEQVYKEHPEGGHEWSLGNDDEIVAWLESKRRDPYPKDVVFKTYEKAFSRAYWVEIVKRSDVRASVGAHMDVHGKEAERRSELFPEAVVRARRDGNAFTITAQEVKELRLWVSGAMIDFEKPLTVTFNGRKAFEGRLRKSVDVLRDEFKARKDPGMTFTATLLIK